MLDDVRRGIWSELRSSRPTIDAFRRALQNDYLALIDRKLNPPPTPANQAQQRFGQRRPPLSDDAKSHLRGELLMLRGEIQRVTAQTTDRSTKMHLEAAVHRINTTPDPKKQSTES